jgi:hypothetical protein
MSETLSIDWPFEIGERVECIADYCAPIVKGSQWTIAELLVSTRRGSDGKSDFSLTVAEITWGAAFDAKSFKKI